MELADSTSTISLNELGIALAVASALGDFDTRPCKSANVYFRSIDNCTNILCAVGYLQSLILLIVLWKVGYKPWVFEI
jgi:hypothetical protein